ncbi:MAG: YhbY family RNA-binding protein [Eubacterium sp.]|jgi:RNA-binding protein|uniref:Putative RNA-binding protein containing KH domain, possibly ribosomal protein n=1 Tax=Eubacterium cellulosolvens (strain ATCC 43171 / JCM 9499 / 6) TaxID=633697 RepID=I5AQV8_EUBC6|nr:YhbY family RNA-binding protein [Eubacterium sp.]
MTSKQRAYLKSLAMKENAILHIGKSGVTPELTENVREALIARELIKIGILQNCMDDPKEMAQTLAERTKSQVVQIIGKKIVLYKEGQGDDRKIVLPK